MTDPLHPPTLYFDVFNGDADGICALHQLRLRHPARSTLITGARGTKRPLMARSKRSLSGKGAVKVTRIAEKIPWVFEKRVAATEIEPGERCKGLHDSRKR